MKAARQLVVVAVASKKGLFMRIPLSLSLVAVCLATTVACSVPQSSAHPDAGVQVGSASGAAPTYTPTATIKDLMDSIVDPAGDLVWDATTTVVDKKGVNETVPRSDDDWKNVRRGALMLVEGANLLQMPGRHMARPGEKSEVPGVELEPTEMEGLVNKDRAAWNRHAQDLHAAGVDVLRAIEAKDAQTLFEVGGKLDTVCESCHRAYWYPNEKVPDFPPGVTTRGAS
jgi:hypothetical protein